MHTYMRTCMHAYLSVAIWAQALSVQAARAQDLWWLELAVHSRLRRYSSKRGIATVDLPKQKRAGPVSATDSPKREQLLIRGVAGTFCSALDPRRAVSGAMPAAWLFLPVLLDLLACPLSSAQPGACAIDCCLVDCLGVGWQVDRGPCSIDEDNCVVSPNFPLEYGNSQWCRIAVEPALGSVATTFWDTENYNDQLQINGNQSYISKGT